MNPEAEQPGGPLAGVRILDMATVIAAPFSSTLCADMGADVVKLELPDGSDPLRGLAPVKGDLALYWKVTNRGKRGITLDVRKPAGRALFLRMLPDFDVLVENFRTGTLDRWGLDIDTLRRANPRLVVLRLTGFGQTGPYAQRAGFARIFEAMSGFTNLTGETGGAPLHMNYPMGDMVAGLFGAFAIASAIAERRRPGNETMPGQEIDLAATEALFRLLEPLAVEYEQLGQVRQRAGNRATYTAPSNMYATADGQWVSLVASSGPIFRRLCQAIGQPGVADDPRFATNPSRVRHLDALDEVVARWFGSHAYADVASTLEAHEIPFSKIFSIADIVDDPHFQERQAIVRLPDPDLGSIPAPCVVPRFAGHTPPPARSGPGVGEHNAEVYGALGLTAADLTGLREGGVI
ncbi:CaiB/BaiF CoA transferase family protein [Cupriavidus metallidurans]|uniref:Acyl-CoA transferase/carnitine dehydratase n=1 Tax=Cupriavidus metallidurans (strain ATCC 43123 / DSM 2839 / NBRC 102507 / CH34) TaxID=266264 RepID=Q1LMD4_CUPMC|nr:CoA transferase [Cupriavidus metallidurans]ABF08692.1 acyl-CoA transferase/carnitine dehydratase [Cupriavidus metallidurans CH34]QGS30383.1 CoA transferase [Cupriavidus metallidurans]